MDVVLIVEVEYSITQRGLVDVVDVLEGEGVWTTVDRLLDAMHGDPLEDTAEIDYAVEWEVLLLLEDGEEHLVFVCHPLQEG